MTKPIEIQVRVAKEVDDKPLPEGVVPVFTVCGARGKHVPQHSTIDTGCGAAVVYDGAATDLPDSDHTLTLCIPCSMKLAMGVARDPGATMDEPVFSEHWGEDEKQMVRDIMARLAKPQISEDEAMAMFEAATDSEAAVKAHYAVVPIPEDEDAKHSHMMGGISALGALMPVLNAATAAGRLPADAKLGQTLCDLVAETIDAMVELHGGKRTNLKATVAAMEAAERGG